MSQRSFKRNEVKYQLQPEQLALLLPVLEANLGCDLFCPDGRPYQVSNIYFDTPSNSVIRRSISKPAFKSKLRLRRYNAEDRFYLELKKKVSGTVFKRRVRLTKEETINFLDDLRLPQRSAYVDSVIIGEICTFLNLYPELRPQVAIRYQRRAFQNPPDADFLRVTVDTEVASSRTALTFDESAGFFPLIGDGALIEIKMLRGMPLWLARALSFSRVYPTSFSKYGAEYKRSLQAKELTNV